MLGGAHQRRHISINRGNSHDFAVLIADRRGGQGKIEALAILASPPHDFRLQRVQRREAQFFRMFEAQRLGHDQIDEQGAGEFRRLILKNIAEGAIGVDHRSTGIDADNGVDGIGDNRRQLLRRLLAAPQFGLVDRAMFAAKGRDMNRRRRALPDGLAREVEIGRHDFARFSAQQQKHFIDGALASAQRLGEIGEKLAAIAIENIRQFFLSSSGGV